MGLFGWWKKQDIPEPPSMAWDGRPSVYDHIRQHCVAGKAGLAEGGMTLPDEERLNQGSEIRWASGAMDGVLTHHMGSSESDDQVERTVQLIVHYCNQPTATNKSQLYESLLGESVISQLDNLIERLIARTDRNDDRLYDLARSLVLEAPDREPVKLGVALLGLFRNPRDLEVFLTVGRHDEFTLYSAVAIQNQENVEYSLWELGKNVFGWGRIHVVERLSETADPKIQDWLLRDGFRNEVLYEYLTGLCARAGRLREALQRETVDRELLTSACEIVSSWLLGGPVASITSYEEGVDVVRSLLGHLKHSATTLGDLTAVSAIRSFLTGNSPKSEDAVAHGWTEEVIESLKAQCDEIISRPEWRNRIASGLESSDERTFSDADRCAHEFGISTWDHHWRRLVAEPRKPERWFHVMRSADAERIDDVIALAEKELPLERIACGPADCMGLGPEFNDESCLDSVVQDLGKYVGKGTPLLKAALKSRVIRLRVQAVAALEKWGRENWWPNAAEELAEAASIEPDDDVRDQIRRLLAGLPTDQQE